MRTIFDKLSDAYDKYYSLTKHLAVDEIIVMFEGKVIFKQCIPKRDRWFGIKIYKLSDSKVCAYNMSVCLDRNKKLASAAMTAAHITASGLTTRTENLGHKLCMDSVPFLVICSDSLCTKAKHCCGTVRPNRKGMPTDIGRKLRLKQNNIKTRLKGDLTAVVWNDR
jgi:hypothetical protein